jgi:hypothetical protein
MNQNEIQLSVFNVNLPYQISTNLHMALKYVDGVVAV